MIQKKGCLRYEKKYIYIEKAQKETNNSEYFTPRSRIDSKYDKDEDDDEDEDEDKDENEKNDRDLYQGSIEGIKVLKLPGEIESKDEKSQTYLGNNLSKIKNNFSDIYDKYQRFLSILLMKKKTVSTTECFHLKLRISIFLTEMVLYTII